MSVILSFHTLIISLYSLFTCMVSEEKSDINLFFQDFSLSLCILKIIFQGISCLFWAFILLCILLSFLDLWLGI